MGRYDGGPAPAASQPPWLSWDHELHLKYVVPFDGVMVRIHLDPLLPHITKLALDAGDRQVKIGACETLHSMVVYMVGR
jgi:DNA-dependent protein kinase catalytic subunit